MSTLNVTIDGHEYEVELNLSARGGEVYDITIDGETMPVILPRPHATVADLEWLIIDGRPYEIAFDPTLQWINAYDGAHTVEVRDSHQRVARPRSGDGRVKAPIPGLLTRVLVEPGMAVTTGQTLLVLEAMKMENEIRAPFDGVVSAVPVAAGQTVVRNQVLAEVQ
jgi:biotin carboxyl carrier protein